MDRLPTSIQNHEQAELESLRKECERLREENLYLRIGRYERIRIFLYKGITSKNKQDRVEGFGTIGCGMLGAAFLLSFYSIKIALILVMFACFAFAMAMSISMHNTEE